MASPLIASTVAETSFLTTVNDTVLFQKHTLCQNNLHFCSVVQVSHHHHDVNRRNHSSCGVASSARFGGGRISEPTDESSESEVRSSKNHNVAKITNESTTARSSNNHASKPRDGKRECKVIGIISQLWTSLACSAGCMFLFTATVHSFLVFSYNH